MNFVDYTMRHALPALGVGARWLTDELQARGVSVPLTRACLRELVLDAHVAAKEEAARADTTRPYVACLRDQIATRAEFVRTWTGSDEPIDREDAWHGLVRLARKYALPRPWKLSEPTATDSLRPTRAYIYWAGAS